MEALRQMRLVYARRAFIRVRDMRYIELLNQIEIARRGRSSKDKWKATESKVAAKNLLNHKAMDLASVTKQVDAREKLPSQDQVFLGKNIFSIFHSSFFFFFLYSYIFHCKPRGHYFCTFFFSLFLGHILAYQSRFADAARVFEKAGHVDLAIEMFLDLKRYDDAKNYASKGQGSSKHSVSDLMKRQAEWSRATADWRSAAQMYADAGEYVKAIELLSEHHGVEPMMDIVHKLDGKTDQRELRLCADYFSKNGHHSKAKQVYLKINAIEELLRLHMKMNKWEEALALTEQPEYHGKFDDVVYLPYAEYLAGADRFDEAQAAYKRAGRPEESLKLLTALAECAQVERRFEAAARYYRQLSQEHLRVAKSVMDGGATAAATNGDAAASNNSSMAGSPGSSMTTIRSEREILRRVEHHRLGSEESLILSGVYFSYALIHQYTEDPFTNLEGDVVFSACCYLMNTLTCKSFRTRTTALHISGLDPPGISRVHVLYAMAQTCILENIQAYKLARWAIQQLQQQAVPSLWQDQIDRTIVSIQSKPFTNREGLAITCNRCLHVNPLVNNIGTGDRCVHCSQPFYRCYSTFDVLPFVAFEPADGLSQAQAVKMLSQLPGGDEESSELTGAARAKSPVGGGRGDSSNGFDGDILGGSEFDDGSYGGRRGGTGAGYGRGAYGGSGTSGSSSSSRETTGRNGNRANEEAFNRQVRLFCCLFVVYFVVYFVVCHWLSLVVVGCRWLCYF